MAIQLFDYMDLLFSTNENKWNELSDIEKSRNFFMMNRFISIQFPNQVKHLSLLRIDAPAVADHWHRFLSKKFNSTPRWVYAKTVKKTEQEKKLNLPSEEMIKWHCERNEIGRKEFDQNVKFFGETFVKELKSLEKLLKSQGVL